MRIASRRSSSASCDEIATLKSEAKAANNMVTSVSRRVKSARSELRSLQATANRMILSQEDMVCTFGHTVITLALFVCGFIITIVHENP